MNLTSMKYVIEIVKSGSITKAAKELFISQPSLSMNIKALEREVGFEIFDRDSTPIALTKKGDVFYNYAKTVLRATDQMYSKTSVSPKNLRIGIIPPKAIHLLPTLLCNFSKVCPDCSISLYEYESSILIDLLDKNVIDVLIAAPYEIPTKHTVIPIFQEEYGIAIPNTWNFHTKKAKLDVDDFKDFPLAVLRADLHIGMKVRNLFSDCGIIPNIRIECSGTETAFALTRHGLVASFLPISYSSPEVKVFPLADQIKITRELIGAYNDTHLSDELRSFINILLE